MLAVAEPVAEPLASSKSGVWLVTIAVDGTIPAARATISSLSAPAWTGGR